MEQVAFFAGALGALGGAVAVIALRNPFYSVLALVVHLFSLAGLFLMLHAEFVAAAQVVVYAGAVMVLYVFVAAYVGGFEEPLWDAIPGQRLLAPLLAGALFIELSIAILGTGLKSLDAEGPTIQAGFGSPEAIGTLFLERFLIPFEAASMLLLIAAVGAVVLAARRPPMNASNTPGDPLAIEPSRFNPPPTPTGAGTTRTYEGRRTEAHDARDARAHRQQEGGVGDASAGPPPDPPKAGPADASPVTPGQPEGTS